MMEDWVVFALVYALSLNITLWYALIHKQAKSDRLEEYEIYLKMIQQGKWSREGMIHSCVTVTLFPYLIHRLTHLNPQLIFRMFPCFIYALMPAFTYLIAREYFGTGYSILACLFLLSHFYFLYYPDIGRVSIALGFLAGMLWAILNGYIALASALAIPMLLSHYGTTYFALYILGITWIILLCAGNFSHSFITLSVTLGVLALSTYIWHWLVAKQAGRVCWTFIRRSITFDSATLVKPKYSIAIAGEAEKPRVEVTVDLKILAEGRRNGVAKKRKFLNFLKLEHRDILIQVAFGKTFRYMKAPQRIEFIVSWLMVLCLLAGFILAIRQIGLVGPYLALMLAMFTAIIITATIPHVSVFYGMARAYFTSLIVLAPCFVVGAGELSRLIGWSEYALPIVLIALYALCVSGVIHFCFGIDKRKGKTEIVVGW